uniref:Transposase, MuDR n=1 Tax=Tanacetum cinerariifolium TaxID=118510 RepID=A0A6L2M6P5_TANCI|nr:transposase, MuDR [Tanacetum cinerariifolium]
MRYRGGKANWIDDVDADYFLAIEVATMVNELGYQNKGMRFYYKIPNSTLDNGLKPLNSDKDVMDMYEYVRKCKVMDVFVIYRINEFDPLFTYVDKNTELAQSSDLGRPSGSNVRDSEANASKKSMVIEELDGTNSNVASDASKDSQDSDDSDFEVEQEDMIDDVKVDMADFKE